MGKKKDEGPKTQGAYCENCKTPSSFYLYNPNDCSEYHGKPTRFLFATCQRCEAPMVFSALFDDEGDTVEPLVKVFPVHRNSLTCALPERAARSYEEAIRCEETGASLATVVMVGRTLEAVCLEHFPDAKNLTIFKGMDQLHKDGVISDQLKSWADQLRVLRNIGAHATDDVVSLEDAQEALDFLKAILENLYDLSPKFQKFMARRSAPDPLGAT